MTEITDVDREQALTLAEKLDGAIGPATQLKILERFLAEQREQLTRVDLYDDGDSIDLIYGNPDGIAGWDVPTLICYTLTLPSGHVFRLAPWQLRALGTAINAEEPL